MKKFIVCALMIIAIMPFSAVADGRQSTGQSMESVVSNLEVEDIFIPHILDIETIEDSTLYYAYLLDLESADELTTSRILRARNEIIFNQESWVADGFILEIMDSDGNVIRTAPQFSDLFPSDWEIPIMHSDEDEVVDSNAPNSLLELWFMDSITLQRPPSNTNSPDVTWGTMQHNT